MQARALTIRVLWLAMAASLLVPCLLFAFASWMSKKHIDELTSERLVRSIDLEQEEARTIFLLVNHALDDVSEIVAGMSASDIRGNERLLYDRLRKLVAQIPLAQSIWIYDANGDVLVSTTVQPPPSHNFADRDFIRAHAEKDVGTYYGRVYQPLFGRAALFHGQPALASRRLFRRGHRDFDSPEQLLPVFLHDGLRQGPAICVDPGGRRASGALPHGPARRDRQAGRKRPASAAP